MSILEVTAPLVAIVNMVLANKEEAGLRKTCPNVGGGLRLSQLLFTAILSSS